MQIHRTGPAAVPSDALAVTIPMRDGVRLAADVYASDPGVAQPVVLVRLPYDKDGEYCFMPRIARYFAARGYTVVVQDVRGKYRSEGATEFGVHEVDDGYDTVDWVARQPWCGGDVLMWGDSYFGMTQLAAAASGHPALRAIAPRLTGTRLGTTLPGDAEQTARRAYFASHYVDRDYYEWEPDWTRRPLLDAFDEFFTALGHRSAAFDADLRAPDAQCGPAIGRLLAAPPVPVLFTVGYYDNCAVWSWHDIEALAAHPGWAPMLHLRLEAIDHENNRLRDLPVGEPDIDAMLPRILDPAIAFFDRHADRIPRVTYEICHGGWHTAERWPPEGSIARELYVVADDPRHGRLVPEPPVAAGELRWTADGDDLVPSVAANPFALLAEFGDLAAIGDRPDVVTVDAAVVDVDTVLAGPVELRGVLHADVATTDLFVRLLDVAPSGAATLILKGQARIAGESRVTVPLLHTAYRLRKGHRLRLHLASSDFPQYMFTTGDGSDAWTARRAADATTVLTDAVVRLHVLGGSDE